MPIFCNFHILSLDILYIRYFGIRYFAFSYFFTEAALRRLTKQWPPGLPAWLPGGCMTAWLRPDWINTASPPQTDNRAQTRQLQPDRRPRSRLTGPLQQPGSVSLYAELADDFEERDVLAMLMELSSCFCCPFIFSFDPPVSDCVLI